MDAAFESESAGDTGEQAAGSEPEAAAEAPASPKKKARKKKAKKKTKKKAKKKSKKKAKKKAAPKKKRKKPKLRPGELAGDPIPMGSATKLVIVESPAKAKTINKYLGKDYKVVASMGHVRDLPKNRFGIDIENDFEPRYVEIYRKRRHTRELRKAAKIADEVWLCPDPDREGEAIAWHLAEALKVPEAKARRVTFTEITQRAVKEAFQHPRDIDLDLVEAQQARRILDRVVGYKLSPLLWRKVIKRLSAGRVQSVAARIICEREDEIDAFIPDEFWRITARLSAPGTVRKVTFESELKGRRRPRGEDEKCPVCRKSMNEMNTPRGKILRCTKAPDCPGSLAFVEEGAIVIEDVKPTKEAEAMAVLAEVEGRPFIVSEVQTRETRSRPSAPFSTSTLQQAAASRLRFTAKRTMMTAQRLYEGIELGPLGSVGLITYMRTDSFNISAEAVAQARDFIKARHGEEYLPEKPNVYRARKGAQEAHEAIRPTSVANTPETVERYLEPDQLKLYKLIWSRFVACQMTPAVYDDTSATILAGDYVFPAHGRVMKFPGCTAIYGPIQKKGDKGPKSLPPLAPEQELETRSVTPSQHFTQPPSRFSEASLVKTLEKEGIGRPSTYAAIITTIQTRGYVKKVGSSFHATELGRIVNKKLVDFFPSVVDVGFTAQMESRFDEIGEGKQDWVKLLQEFYGPFAADLERADKEMPAEADQPAPDGETCVVCNGPMVIKLSRKGRFLGCAKFPDCRYSQPLGADGKAVPVPEACQNIMCPNCGTHMVLRLSRRGRFLACPMFPTCRTVIPVDDDGKPVELESTDEVCEKCGSPMAVRFGNWGKFLACTGYPKCRNARPMPGSLPGEEVEGVEPCDKCGSQMVLRRTKKRGYLLCSKLPDCKQKRAVDDELRKRLYDAGKPLPGDEEFFGEEGGDADEKDEGSDDDE
jgi:DNA topoisomerase-1